MELDWPTGEFISGVLSSVDLRVNSFLQLSFNFSIERISAGHEQSVEFIRGVDPEMGGVITTPSEYSSWSFATVLIGSIQYLKT
jgi:hypothetical protein